jgi:hypothetical protein
MSDQISGLKTDSRRSSVLPQTTEDTETKKLKDNIDVLEKV